jgi:hypothetical protein
MVRQIIIEVQGKRLQFELKTAENVTHSFMADRVFLWERAVQGFRDCLITNLREDIDRGRIEMPQL